MNVRDTLTLLSVGLVITIAQPASASPAPDAKLWSGTWKLNTAQSKFSAADFSAKAETRTYSVSGRRVTMHASMTTPAGKQIKWTYSANWDGKPYPTVGNDNADHIILMPVSGREVKARTMLKGKPSANTTASVSADGKQITMQRSILTAKGGPSHDVLVYDRMK